MRYIRNEINKAFDTQTVITLGKFDGVHRGHMKLLDIVKDKALREQLTSVVFTFDRIPLRICPSKQQQFITTNTERKDIIAKEGIDILIEYPFTEEFMDTSPEEFIKIMLVERLKAKCIVVGSDFGFGKNRAGNADMIKKYADEYGYEAIVVKKEMYGEREISSTYVREELKKGNMETANELLGKPYFIEGVVTKGMQLGRTINIPTVNIYPCDSKLLPPFGVYVSEVMVRGRLMHGVTNIGTRPTVSNDTIISVETNIFDFDEDIYGEQIEVRILHYLRPEMKFDSVDSLKKQMDIDTLNAKKHFQK